MKFTHLLFVVLCCFTLLNACSDESSISPAPSNPAPSPVTPPTDPPTDPPTLPTTPPTSDPKVEPLDDREPVTLDPDSSPTISSFTLVDTATGMAVPGFDPVQQNAQIDLEELGLESVSFRANTDPEAVGSVLFTLDGELARTENYTPYALAGDVEGGGYNSFSLPNSGHHSLKATAHTSALGEGTAGEAYTLNFVVGKLRDAPDVASCEGVATPTFPEPIFSPEGAVGDGVTDDTASLKAAYEKAAEAGGTLRLESGKTYLISDTLQIAGESGFALDGNGATLKRVAETQDEHFIMLWFYRSSNYTVANLTLDGNRDNRVPKETARAHNIVVSGGSDFNFFDVHSNNATADGYYIGAADDASDTDNFPTNGLFQNSSGSNNFRQGISLINGYDIRVLGGVYKDTNGTAPASGIDLEPNPGALPGIRNVYICGVSFLNNEGHGLTIGALFEDSVTIQNVRAEHNLYADNFKSGVHTFSNPTKIEAGIQNVTFQYSTFVNNANQPRIPEGRGVGLRINAAKVLVQNNIFAEHGAGIHRSVLDLPASSLVSDNLIRQNTFRDNAPGDWYAIYVHSLSGTNNQAVDNIVVDNAFKAAFRNAKPEGTCFAGNVVDGKVEAGNCGEAPEAGSTF